MNIGYPKYAFEQEAKGFITSYFRTFHPYSYMAIKRFDIVSQEVLPTPMNQQHSRKLLRALQAATITEDDDPQLATLLLVANITAGSRLKSDALLTRVTLNALNSDELTVEIKEADEYFQNVTVRGYEDRPELEELLPKQVISQIRREERKRNAKNFPIIVIVLVAAVFAFASVVAFVLRLSRQPGADCPTPRGDNSSQLQLQYG